MNQTEQALFQASKSIEFSPSASTGTEKMKFSDFKSFSQEKILIIQPPQGDYDPDEAGFSHKYSEYLTTENPNVKTCDTNHGPNSEKAITRVTNEQNFEEEKSPAHLSSQGENFEDNKEQLELQIVDEARTSYGFLQTNRNRTTRSQHLAINIPEIRTRTNQQSESLPENSRSHIIWEPEVKMYLTKTIGFPFTILVLSVIWLLTNYNTFNYKYYFYIVHGYLIYIGSIDFFWGRKILGNLWMESGIVSELDNVVTGSFSLLLVYFKFSGVTPFSSLAIIPFIILIVFSFLLSKAAVKIKVWENFLRLLVLIQILLVTLKIDGRISLDWLIVFLVLWIFLKKNLYDCFKYTIALSKQIKIFLKQRNHAQGSEAKTKVIGFFWCILYFGFSWIGIPVLAIISIVCATSSSNNFRFITITACYGISISLILLAYTIAARKFLVQFVISIKLIECYFAESIENGIKDQKDEVTLQVEKKTDYFVMISSTYFVSLNSSFKGQESIRDVKKRFRNLELGKLKFHTQHTQNVAKLLSQSIDYKNPQEEPQDKKSPRILETRMDTNKRAHTDCSFERNCLDPISSIRKGGAINTKEEIKPTQKLIISVDDLDEVERLRATLESPKAVPNQEKALCYICYTNEPDAILMDCGHGGVCYSCVINIAKKKGRCMECRGEIEAIQRISPEPIFSHIYIGTQKSKIIKEK